MARARPIADLIAGPLGPALAAQGFSGSDLVASWPEIVGERLVAVSRPAKIEWPRRRPGQENARRPDPATLVVRVQGAFALEMQHMAPLLMERINAIYGWRCIGRIVLKQGPVPGRAAPPKPARVAGEAELRRIAAAVAPVAEDGLRHALTRLGAAMAAAAPADTAEPEPESGDSVTLPR